MRLDRLLLLAAAVTSCTSDTKPSVSDGGTCLAMTPRTQLYEDYCGASPGGRCYYDHPPARGF